MRAKLINFIKRKKTGVNRDINGRFAYGSGGLANLKKFNYQRAVPLASVILLVGGLSVYVSLASDGNLWTPGSSGVRLSSRVRKAKDNNNIEYWKFEIPTDQGGRSKYKRAGSLTLTNKPKGTNEYCTTIQNYLGSIRVRWSGADASYSGQKSGSGFKISGKSLYINQPLNQDFCVTADTGKGNLTISIDYLSNASTPITQVAVYKITKNNNGDQDKSEEPKGKVGFTWTQDNIMIPSKSKSEVANIHMYGWGSLWPFIDDAPRSEADSGEILKSRIEKASKDGQEVMITACCAPSTFSTTGKAWDLDSSRVRDDKERLYANRVAEFVSKYPQVKYVQVWNELKGYWDTEHNTWDAESYTRFYNKVYKAVKARRPNVKVSGGYVVFSANSSSSNNALYNGVNIDKRSVEALQYWLDHAHGFDAISLDAFVAPKDFPKIMEYVRKMQRAKDKPIWWAEFYNRPSAASPFTSAGNPYGVAKEIIPSMKKDDILLYWAERKFITDINKLLR